MDEGDAAKEDILHSVETKIAENCLKSYSRTPVSAALPSLTSVDVPSEPASQTSSAKDGPGVTVQPCFTNSDLLSDVSSPWFTITKTVTGKDEAAILQERLDNDDGQEVNPQPKLIFHVGNTMMTSNPVQDDVLTKTRKGSKLLVTNQSTLPGDIVDIPSSSVSVSRNKKTKTLRIKNKSNFIDDGTEPSKETYSFIWKHGWKVDEMFLSNFETKLDQLVKKRTKIGEEIISPSIALTREKGEVEDLVRAVEVDKMIEFYSDVFTKFIVLKDHFSHLDTCSLSRYLSTYHSLDHRSFLIHVTTLENLRMNNVETSEHMNGIDEDEEDFIESIADSDDVEGVGSGTKVVQFFYHHWDGSKISFPPVRVKDDYEAKVAMAFIEHCSRRFYLRHNHQRSDSISTDAALAKVLLPREVLHHIKTCFTMRGVELMRPGRRTHQGVKKSEKVPSHKKTVLTLHDQEPFVPPSSSSSGDTRYRPSVSERVVTEELESNKREYFLRSLLPRLNNGPDEVSTKSSLLGDSSGVIEQSVEDDIQQPVLARQEKEPEKIVDLPSLRKKRRLPNEDDEELDLDPTEEDYQNSLENEVFGFTFPKAVSNKRPRQGAVSDREKGRGGRNEILKNKIDEANQLKGVEYLLQPNDPKFQVPDFKSMFKVRNAKRKALKMEDLEDEGEDEDFKALGVPKPKKGVERRTSKRLKEAEERKESGEYFRQPKTEFVVELQVETEENDTEGNIDCGGFLVSSETQTT